MWKKNPILNLSRSVVGSHNFIDTDFYFQSIRQVNELGQNYFKLSGQTLSSPLFNTQVRK